MTTPPSESLPNELNGPNEPNGRMRRRLRRGAYLLPSLFTTGNMLLGFYAVVLGIHGRFQIAALLVFVAGILDTLDGRIARMTGTDSDFGKQLDSLADVFTFGAVPALLCYHWGLETFDRAGWLIPLFFLLGAAFRLARFNVQTKIVDSRFFVGLPAPAAAGLICSLLFFVEGYAGEPWLQALVAGSLLAAGALMVSTFRYHSFKKLDLRRRQSYRLLLPLAAAILVVAYHPPAFFLAIAAIYTASGPLGWAWRRLTHREAGVPPTPAEIVSPSEGRTPREKL